MLKDANHFKKTIIYIASDVRSGSTMLDNLLSNHPHAESVGELANLADYFNKGKIGASCHWVCTCGRPIDTCSLWRCVSNIYTQDHGRPLKDVQTNVGRNTHSQLFKIAAGLYVLFPLKRLRMFLFEKVYRQQVLKKHGQELHHIIDAFQQTTSAAIIVDSSKSIEQFIALMIAKPKNTDLKLVHIARDGRAVLYSKIRRADELKQYGRRFRLVHAIARWSYVNLWLLNAKEILNPKDMITVRYEDLCANTETVVRRICNQFNIVFDEAMLRFSGDNKHNVAGSPHRFTWNSESSIRLDTRWQRELSTWYQVIYYLIAGSVHTQLGYRWKRA